ncbi:MAG: hypothetical protein C0490_26275 [Marivirga sp.]|nr:hypothetical protein [Marivirga sp.]
MFHIALHLIVPAVLAMVLFRNRVRYAALIMISTIMVDVDHLLADPVYDPNRCSIGFHPLHSYWAISIYLLMSFWPKTRLIGIGLVIHMALDYLDCL